MSWNQTPFARSQRLRIECLAAGARYVRTRRSQRTPGASARFTPFGDPTNKMVPRSNRSSTSGVAMTSELTVSLRASTVKKDYGASRAAPMPKIDTRGLPADGLWSAGTQRCNVVDSQKCNAPTSDVIPTPCPARRVVFRRERRGARIELPSYPRAEPSLTKNIGRFRHSGSARVH